MTLALEGIRILDCTHWKMGPVATLILGDLGAEVIKVEERVGGDPARGMTRMRGLPATLPGDRNFYFEHNNRNKKSITLDLKKEKGREVLFRLVTRCDAFAHNFRPGVTQRLGIHYEALARHNPRLVYGSVSGFGSRGPEAAEPSFDYLGLARSGILLSCLGEPGWPPADISGGIADQLGGIMLAFAIVTGLLARERLGVGQEVEVSHLSSMSWLQATALLFYTFMGREFPRERRSEASNPLWNHYRCSDERWIVLGHLQPDRYWPTLCRALGLEELEKDPRFDNALHRQENSRELVALLDRIFATQPSDYWLRHLKGTGDFICTRIQSLLDLVQDPQMAANHYLIDYAHPVLGPVKTLAPVFQLSQTPGAVRLPAPEFGQHTEEVLREVGGYTWEEIERLREAEVI